MNVRPEVSAFVALGPLPSSTAATESDLRWREHLLHAIHAPLTREEADALITCFGPDDCFGLAWTLLHLVESTPGPAITNQPDAGANEWVKLLWDSAHR